MRLAIDTNAYRAIDDGDATLAALLRSADSIGLPSIVLGEIRAGILLGTKREPNTIKLAKLLANPRLQFLAVDEETTAHYAALFAQLRTQGTPIPTNDIWIAALCLQHGFMLATLDTDFTYIPQLQLVGLGK